MASEAPIRAPRSDARENRKRVLVAARECFAESLDAQMQDIIDISKRHNAFSVESSSDPATRAKLWKARKSAFGAIGKISPSYCTQDACVPRSMLGEVLARVDEIGKQYGLQINNVFHAGDGNVHPIFLYDDRSEEQMQNTLRAAEDVLKYCIDVGGTLTGEHGVGVEKIHLMPYQFDELTMTLFQRVKDAFDPTERINAGKLLPFGFEDLGLLGALDVFSSRPVCSDGRLQNGIPIFPHRGTSIQILVNIQPIEEIMFGSQLGEHPGQSHRQLGHAMALVRRVFVVAEPLHAVLVEGRRRAA
jgi:hypothetical protein